MRSSACLRFAVFLICTVRGFLSFSPTRTFISRHHRTQGAAVTGRRYVSTPNKLKEANDSSFIDAAIVGGGPAGLLAAIMLAQKYPNKKVKVFDRLRPPPSPSDETVWSDVARFYLLGLGFRGQQSLKAFEVWDAVKLYCNPAVGRMDWAPDAIKYEDGVERIFTDRPAVTEVIPRDKLVSVLHEEILTKYSDQIELQYEYEVQALDFGDGEDHAPVVIGITKCTDSKPDPTCQDEPQTLFGMITMKTDLLIAAEGSARTIASQIEADDMKKYKSMGIMDRLSYQPFQVTKYVDDNQRVYKSIPMQLPPEWRPDLNYSARSKDGRVIFDALPANSQGSYCGVLLLQRSDELAASDTDPKALRELFDEYIPQFSPLVDESNMAAIAKKAPSYLPSFRFAGPRLNYGERTVVLGDAAHTVKPYFGLGVNSAFQDVEALSNCLDSSTTLKEAVEQYSKQRSGEAEAMVKISRGLDRPGTLGLLAFIIPLLLDTLFNKVAPNLFEANILAMFQRTDYDFRSIQKRKRLDRFNQMFCLASIGYATSKSKFMFTALAKATGKSAATMTAAIFGAVATALFVRKAAFFFLPGLAPADVIGKVDPNQKT